MENLPSLPDRFDLVPIERNANRIATLRKLLKRKDVGEVWNACDAGREGELIFRNIIRAVGAKQPLKRLWLQSMTMDAIRSAFKAPRPDSELLPLADAAVSRSEADWLVGINSTRALTAFNSRGGGFNKTTAGRVQTPTLAILVEREEKIRAFVPRSYFEVHADFTVEAGSYSGRWFDPDFKKNPTDEDLRPERLWDRAKAEAIRDKCQGKPGIIEETKKPQTQAPPLLYDLTTLQREANSRFGFPARMTLQIAQALYEKHKVLTYPRTDSRYLPEDYLPTVKTVMGSFDNAELAKHANHALTRGYVKPNRRVFNNAKVSDHFAIVPTGTAPSGLDEKEWKLYDLVSRRFIAVFYPNAQFEVTTRITTVRDEKFRTDGKIITDPGWMIVYGKGATGEDDEKTLVAVNAGEPALTERVEVKDLVTRPPARYSEATLLSAMEGAGKLVDDEELREAMSERGLGTPATRAQIIEGLLDEGYITRDGRDLVTTQKGISLITLLKNLDAATLTQPALTGEWEFKLKSMERGVLSRDAFMREIRTLTSDIVHKVKTYEGGEIQGNFRPLAVECPKCGQQTFKETFKSFTCPGCALTVWKSVAGRELERDEVFELLSKGRVGPLDGFRSRLGRAFSAPLILNKEAEFKVEFAFEKAADTNGAPNLEGATRLGETEHGVIYDTESAYICVPSSEGGKPVRMGKTICQRPIPQEQAIKLFNLGKTDLLQRFISKAGRPFAAYLKLEGEKVVFEFEPRPAKAGATKPGTAKAAAPKGKGGKAAAEDELPKAKMSSKGKSTSAKPAGKPRSKRLPDPDISQSSQVGDDEQSPF
jgi:DNA topoisomerase-3